EPSTAPRRRTRPWTWGRGGGDRAPLRSRVRPALHSVLDIFGDRARRRIAERRETRPVVDVNQHRAVRRRKRDVPAEHLEPEALRRVERHRLERRLVDRGPVARTARTSSGRSAWTSPRFTQTLASPVPSMPSCWGGGSGAALEWMIVRGKASVPAPRLLTSRWR